MKIPGHNRWSGRGEQTYDAAEIQVLEITKVKQTETLISGTADCIMAYPARLKTEPQIPEVIRPRQEIIDEKAEEKAAHKRGTEQAAAWMKENRLKGKVKVQ